MQEENNDKDVKVEVLAERLDGMRKDFSSLNASVQKFLDVVLTKVDVTQYRDDKHEQGKVNENHAQRILNLENFKNGLDAGRKERGTIAGIGKDTIAVIVQIASLITILLALLSKVA